MMTFGLILLAFCEGVTRFPLGTFSLLDIDREQLLHDTSPHTYRSMANFVIDSPAKWSLLEGDSCFIGPTGLVPLVELRDFCSLPSPTQIVKLSRQFILFGPFYDWHHVNFGPHTEFEHSAGEHIFESRTSNKLSHCTNATRGWIWNLADSPALLWWITHQQVAPDLRHPKLRVMPIGFGYQGWRIGNHGDVYIELWRRELVSLLYKWKHTRRSTLVLKSFTIHTNLFGTMGDDPRSNLSRELEKIPSLREVPLRHFDTAEQFSEAVRRSMFVLSPWGWGPDCFRHYEAIAQGAIPIVLDEWSTNRALEGLPHLRVKSWSELNREKLEREYEVIHSQSYDLRRLTREYWLRELFQRSSNASVAC